MQANDVWHRRQALAIAVSLPEDLEDARLILRLTTELLNGFISQDQRTGVILPLTRTPIASGS